MWLPTETETTPCAKQTSFCCTRGKQIKIAGISTGLLLIEHVQHLRTSAATHDARTTTQTHGRPWRRPSGPPHASPSHCALAGGSQSRVGPRCATRCDRACPRWRPSDILPQDGHMREEEWETKADRGHAVAQCQRHSGNTSHSIPVPSGQIGTCSLHRDDRHLTTFITPWGRYRYRVAPQGYVASGDGYSRRFDEIASDFPDKTKCIDDTLLWATDLEASFHQATKWLDLCGRSGITLNPEKFVFGADTVEFGGFEITRDSVRPSQKYLRAIRSFPIPQNITDIRNWFGLINQVAYPFSMTERMSPFRSLLKPDTRFQWDDTLQKLFEESKTVILDEICKGVKIFDKTKPTCLVTAWSKDGTGLWLLQKYCDCQTTPASKPFCCNTG